MSHSLARTATQKPGFFREAGLLPIALLLCCSVRPLCANTFDATFYSGLRARGLYRLAEKQARDRWLEKDGPLDVRADLAIELARTYAEWAVASPPSERLPLWKKAHRITAQFAQIAPDHPRRLLVDLQDALSWLAAGELARLEATGYPNASAFDVAKQRLRHAIRAIEEISKQVDAGLRKARLARTAPADGKWTVAELEGLARHTAIELARALRNQALCYRNRDPTESDDRVNALTRALEYLDRPGVTATSDRLGWRARLDQLACHRRLGHSEEARERMRTMLAADPPDEVTLRIEAERVRLLLAESEVSAALTAMQKSRTLNGLASRELDVAHLECLLAAWKADRTKAGVLTPRITSQVRLIRDEHGPASGRMAELLVGRTFATRHASIDGSHDGGSDLDALRMAAEALYRAGKTGEAITAYDQAAQTAKNNGDTDRGFHFRFTAAAIEQQANGWPRALDRYCRLAESMPQHARAAEAHRMAILCAAHRVRHAKTNDEREMAGQLYASLLESHESTWPNSPTADDAWFWHGQWLESSRDRMAAIRAYKCVRQSSKHYAAAMEGIASLYELQLARQSDKQEQAVTVREATQFLQPSITGPGNRWPVPWTPHQRSLALALARMHIRYADGGEKYARQMLTAAMARPEGAESAWLATARSLLSEALLAEGKMDEAVEQLQQVPDDLLDAVRWIDVMTRLLQQSKDQQTAVRAAFALDLIQRLGSRSDALGSRSDALGSRSDALDEPVRSDLVAVRAAALDALGRRDEALAIYAQLVEKRPNDGDLLERLARLLGQTDHKNEWQPALRAWHEVERRSKPGGPRWFRARYARCRLLIRFGRRDEAAKLIRLTAALHPDLGGPAMRQAFAKL